MSKKSELSALKEIWYKKLEDSGFEDIEQDEDNLKEWSSQFRRKVSLHSWEAKASYYSMAATFLNDYKFETELERIVWEYHANGISMRDIVGLLKQVNVKKNKDSVNQLVMRLKLEMYNLYMKPKRRRTK